MCLKEYNSLIVTGSPLKGIYLYFICCHWGGIFSKDTNIYFLGANMYTNPNQYKQTLGQTVRDSQDKQLFPQNKLTNYKMI